MREVPSLYILLFLIAKSRVLQYEMSIYSESLAILNRLYEQRLSHERYDTYWRRWLSWSTGGIQASQWDTARWIRHVAQWHHETVAPIVGATVGEMLWRSFQRHVLQTLSRMGETARSVPLIYLLSTRFHAREVIL